MHCDNGSHLRLTSVGSTGSLLWHMKRTSSGNSLGLSLRLGRICSEFSGVSFRNKYKQGVSSWNEKKYRVNKHNIHEAGPSCEPAFSVVHSWLTVAGSRDLMDYQIEIKQKRSDGIGKLPTCSNHVTYITCLRSNSAQVVGRYLPSHRDWWPYMSQVALYR